MDISTSMALWKDFGEFERATNHLPRIQMLETMATFSCTLSCKYCNTYSDYGMKGGYVRWSQMQSWLDVLFSRLRIDCFNVIGGEPFLNPEFKLWVHSFRQRYPYITLMIITNGTLLDKNWWILDSMQELGMIYLKISNHQPHLSYVQQAKEKILARFDWQYQGDDLWFEPSKILDLRIDNTDTFLRTFKGDYGSMKPYDSDPTEAFKICNQQLCPLFVDGKLYKCSTAGLLHRVLKDHSQLDDLDWKPYVDNGLSLDCSNDDLQAWANNFGKPHAICRMCPVLKDQPFHDHFKSVTARIALD